MKVVLKILGGAAVVVVVLIVAAVVLIPLLIDPNDHKDRITEVVEQHTGRELRIPGDIGLSVFPWLGLELGAVELGNAPGFEGDTFARTEKVGIRLKLLPLLSREVEMDTLTIQGLVLNLERRRDGTRNWDDLVKREAEPKPDKPSGDGPGLAGLAIGGIDVRDAQVNWNDAQGGRRLRVSDLQAQTGPLAVGRPIDVNLAFGVSGTEPPVTGRVTLSARVISDLAARRHALSDLVVKIALEGAGLPGGALAVALEAGLDLDLAQQTAVLSPLELAIGDLEASGRFTLTKLLDAPAFQGQIEVAEFSPRELLARMGLPAVETADPEVLSTAALSATVAGTPAQLKLEPLQISLDQTRLGGSVQVVDLARRAVRFDLTVDEIDADRYLPPPLPPEARAAAPPVPAAAAAASGQLPVATLRGVDAAGTAKIGLLKIAKLSVSEALVTLNAKDGLVRLNPVQAKLYQGSYVGDITIDARRDPLVVSVDEKLAGVQAGPLLKDLRDSDRLSGQAAVRVQLTARGNEPAAMRRSLQGRVRFDFTDGAVKGLDLNQMLREARAKLTGQPVPQDATPKQTDFSELGGTVVIADAVAKNDDLSAQSPFLRVSGNGQAHLVEETIDYRLSVKVVANAAGQGGEGLQELAGVSVPIRVGGTFAEPKYGLDFEALASSFAASKAGALVDAKKEELKERAVEKIGEKLGGAALPKQLGEGAGEKVGGALKGLLGR